MTIHSGTTRPTAITLLSFAIANSYDRGIGAGVLVAAMIFAEPHALIWSGVLIRSLSAAPAVIGYFSHHHLKLKISP